MLIGGAQQKPTGASTGMKGMKGMKGCHGLSASQTRKIRYSTAAVPDEMQGCGGVAIGGAWQAKTIEENSHGR